MKRQGRALKDNKKRVFSSGAIRDSEEEKEDYVETISWTSLKRYAKYMTNKQDKYGKGNWKKGIPIDSYERSLMRHIQKYFSNKYHNTNIESNEDHLSAAIFNIQGIMDEEEKINNKRK